MNNVRVPAIFFEDHLTRNTAIPTVVKMERRFYQLAPEFNPEMEALLNDAMASASVRGPYTDDPDMRNAAHATMNEIFNKLEASRELYPA